MAARRKSPHDDSTLDFVVRISGSLPRVVASSYPTLELAIIDDYPRSGLTTLVTMGLGADTRYMFRGVKVGFELTLTTVPRHVETLRELLALAATAALASDRGYCSSPPRGLMHNGVHAAASAPHLLFATDLTLTPAFADPGHGHRIADRGVEFLPAIPITADEIDRYDASPKRLIDWLHQHGELEDFTRRA